MANNNNNNKEIKWDRSLELDQGFPHPRLPVIPDPSLLEVISEASYTAFAIELNEQMKVVKNTLGIVLMSVGSPMLIAGVVVLFVKGLIGLVLVIPGALSLIAGIIVVVKGGYDTTRILADTIDRHSPRFYEQGIIIGFYQTRMQHIFITFTRTVATTTTTAPSSMGNPAVPPMIAAAPAVQHHIPQVLVNPAPEGIS